MAIPVGHMMDSMRITCLLLPSKPDLTIFGWSPISVQKRKYLFGLTAIDCGFSRLLDTTSIIPLLPSANLLNHNINYVYKSLLTQITCGNRNKYGISPVNDVMYPVNCQILDSFHVRWQDGLLIWWQGCWHQGCTVRVDPINCPMRIMIILEILF